MLKKLRVALALLFWLCITILFLDLTGATHAWLGWMAKIQLLPAIMASSVGLLILWITVTSLLGRIYCSVICPLGVMQDGFAHLADKVSSKGKKGKLGRYHYWAPRWSKVMRYTIFVLFVLSIVIGGGFFMQWLAPYSSYGRIVTSLIRPLVVGANNLLADWAAQQDSYAFYLITWNGLNLSLIITAIVSLVILMVTSIVGGRFYCNNICPVGTFLGLWSNRSVICVQIDQDKCSKCGLCERKCKSMAIDSKNGKVDSSRCVDCFNCLDACHKGALTYSLRRGAKKNSDVVMPKEEEKVDTSRRTFITTAVAVTVGAKLKAVEKTTDGGLAPIIEKQPYERQTVICPPGSLSLKNLQQQCTGCQLCVSACPNQVLHPSTGLMHYLQPTLSFESGHCRPECHACSDVCPAGAILPLGNTHEEKMAHKSSLKIGRAVWIKDNCLPVANQVSCGNCARQCPSGAITMVPINPEDPKSLKFPSVNDERCIGCGACEHLCPSRPFSAIHVEGIEVQRDI